MNMMEGAHLAGEDEDDLYNGFNNYSSTLDTQQLEYDPAFQQAVQANNAKRPPPTAAARPPGTAAGSRGWMGLPKGIVMPPSSMGARPITGAQDRANARPMTAVRAAGYTSSGGRGFDPLNQGSQGPAPPLEKKNDDSPEEKVKQLEKKVNELIEESCFANSRGEYQLALERAKEAGRKERLLVRQRELLGSNEQMNLDLTYSVLFNLADQYASNNMDNEALNTYQVLVKNKAFSNSGRLKVNIGNLYFRQKQFAKAIKYYRMALDQVPVTHRNMRIKIMQNVSIAFVKLGQYSDAITSFEHIMSEEPNFRTGFNLILCYFALGDQEKMRKTFERLLTVDLKVDDEDKYLTVPDDKQYGLILEVIKKDNLRQIERERRAEAEQCIMMAAKIISPAIDSTFDGGYNWCIEQVKSSQYMDLAHSLDIDKAIGFLKQKEFQQAIETLKSFERKDTKVAVAAATNLSFLYNLEGERSQADKYAELALQADRYNPPALVNKGNVLFTRGDYEKAREFYKEALQNDSSCIEALHNYGICNKKLKRYEDALEAFYKLHSILKDNAQVLYQLGDLHDKIGEQSQAKEWFLQLLAVVPSDAVVLQRIGEMYDAEGDKSQAFQYHYDSYRYDPTNISVIEWLGAYYIDSQFCEKAINYFERASIIQPKEIKWQLMVASCHRRSGNYQQALDTYKAAHRKFSDNVECLKFLVKLCEDMNLEEGKDYRAKLQRAEKSHQLREERVSSGRVRSGQRRMEHADSDRQTSAGSTRGSAARRTVDLNEGVSGPYQMSSQQQPDDRYSDPLGPQASRPRTAAARRRGDQLPGDDFDNEEIGDDLLPE